MKLNSLLHGFTRLAAFLALMFVTSACQLAPFDGQRVSSTSSTIAPGGYLTTPNVEVRVEAFNPSTNTWQLWRSGVRSSTSVSWTMSDGTKLYTWNYSAATLPSQFWKAGSGGAAYGTGGYVARIRSYYLNSDGSRQYIYVGRGDWPICMIENFAGDFDGPGNSLSYVISNCMSHRSEAYVYTTGYREGPSTCPTASGAQTHGHYRLDQIPACAQKIIYDHMAERVNRNLIDDHYRIDHGRANAHRNDSAGACSEQGGGNCTLGGFFGGHERYLRKVERHVMVYDYPWMPGGKIPSWNSATAVPANFSGTSYGWRTAVASPNGNCNSRSCSGWLSNPISATNAAANSSRAKPANVTPSQVCSASTAQVLWDRVNVTGNGWHNFVHNNLASSFSTFDAPSFPLFFAWHNYVNDVWLDWKACGN